ncbi:hypothetical protein [uncultured Streptomyces sp.]|uniref:hypothetical protein n=1 Tax=uncultured Streptomyces sp. TaxID=174707 RepID=UPI00260984A5|nr:hypothetical protein [uncultured Streptomyces sp.]
MRRLVRGFWGPRVESVEELAQRWAATLEAVAGLLPQAGAGESAPWSWQWVRASGPAAPVTGDPAGLAEALAAARTADDWSDAVGTGLRLMRTGAPGWTVEISGTAGGAPQFLLQSLVIGVDAPEEAKVPEADLLAALARIWQPDFGDVSDNALLDALEDDAGHLVGDPAVGRFGHLSPGRAALLPDGVPPERELPDGGVLVAFGDDPAAVVAGYMALRDSGALAPLPRPLDRAAL